VRGRSGPQRLKWINEVKPKVTGDRENEKISDCEL
jgi:hypothetical protein